MEIYRTLTQLPENTRTAVAMGFFDGIHMGHRQVISAAETYARQHGLIPAVFTFELPTTSTMKGKRLFTHGQKCEAIQAMGVEYFLDPDFEEIKNLSPRAFVEEMLHGMYHAKAVFCGENFTFGQKAAGNPEILKELCVPLGIEVIIVPMAQFEGEPVSSTRIRQALEAGELERATAMLGQPYRILFPVLHGQALGRTLGMPTINQHYPEGYQLPKLGIYITRVYLKGVWWPSATGLGTRPTVNDDPSLISCETFIPGYHGNLYGMEVPLEFVHYLEPSHRFENVEQLREAVMGWADAAIHYRFDKKA